MKTAWHLGVLGFLILSSIAFLLIDDDFRSRANDADTAGQCSDTDRVLPCVASGLRGISLGDNIFFTLD